MAQRTVLVLICVVMNDRVKCDDEPQEQSAQGKDQSERAGMVDRAQSHVLFLVESPKNLSVFAPWRKSIPEMIIR
jgi:hypothetical protein